MLCSRLLTLIWCAGQVLSSKILILHPIYSGSHEFVLRHFGDYLVSRGHQVTQVRYKQSNSHTNLDTNVTVVTLNIKDKQGTCGRYVNSKGEVDISKAGAEILWNMGHTVRGLPYDMFCLTDCHCDTLFSNKDLQEAIIESDFDLVIVDLIANECSLAFAQSLGKPMAGFWGFSFHGGEVMYTSTFNAPSVMPSFFSAMPQRMDFWQRLINFCIHLFHRGFMHRQAAWSDKHIRREFPNAPPIHKMVNDVELILVNSNEFVDYPRLLAPNVKLAGGLQIKRSSGHLPPDYEKFVKNAKHGVVLFSLGYTGFSAKDVPVPIVLSFIDAFAKLKQKVIMRFDRKYLPYVPENVMVRDWIPQQDLLAHPKTKAFISHCGIGSVLEAVYHSVPIVGVPIFADQVDNSARVHARGMGIGLDKRNLSEAIVFDAIQRVLYDPRYLKQVRRMSSMWHEKKISPQEEAGFWIEQVLKYKSFDHIRIPDSELTLMEYFCIDIILFLLSIFSIFVFLIIYFCRKLAHQYIVRKVKLKLN